MIAGFQGRLTRTVTPAGVVAAVIEALDELCPRMTATVLLRCATTGVWQQVAVNGPDLVETLTVFAALRETIDRRSPLQRVDDRAICVPVTADGVPVGAFVLVAAVAATVAQTSEAPLEALAVEAGAALVRTRTLDDGNRRRAAQAPAAEFARAAHAATSREALFATIATTVEGLSLGTSNAVFLREGRTGPLRAVNGDEYSTREQLAVVREAVALGQLAVARKSQSELLGPDATQAVAVPLRAPRGAPVGAIGAEIPLYGRVYVREDLFEMEELGDVASLALDMLDARRAVRMAAAQDPETGCLSAEALPAMVASALEAASGQRVRAGLLVLQIDRTDAPYDAATTRLVGERLAAHAGREGFLVFRTRPWQFTVFAPGASLRDARALGDRLRLLVRAGLPGGVTATASVGIACAPTNGSETGALRVAAEAALDAAQAAGPDSEASASGVHDRPQADVGPRESLATLESIARLVDEIHFRGRPHSQAVAQRVRSIAVQLGLDHAAVASIGLAGELHDVGRALLPLSVFEDPDPSEQTIALIKTHVVLGARLIGATGFPRAARAVAAMHEHWDGGGKPSGLRGGAIPLEGRILAVANAYETILDSLGREIGGSADAVAHLRKERGRAFDARIVDVLLTRVD